MRCGDRCWPTRSLRPRWPTPAAGPPRHSGDRDRADAAAAPVDRRRGVGRASPTPSSGARRCAPAGAPRRVGGMVRPAVRPTCGSPERTAAGCGGGRRGRSRGCGRTSRTPPPRSGPRATHWRARLPGPAGPARVVVGRARARSPSLAARVFELEAAGCDQSACPWPAWAGPWSSTVRTTAARCWPSSTAIPPGSLNDVWQGVVSWLRSTIAHAPGLRRPRRSRPPSGRWPTPGRCTHRWLRGPGSRPCWFQGHGRRRRRRAPGSGRGEAGRAIATTRRLPPPSAAVVHALLGQTERAARAPRAGPRRRRPSPDAPLVDTDLAIAEAALAWPAATTPRRAPSSPPTSPATRLGEGHSAAPQQRSLALFYVLVARYPAGVGRRRISGPAFAVAPRPGPRARRGPGRTPRFRPTRRHCPTPPSSGPTCPCAGPQSSAVAAIAAGRRDGWQLLDGIVARRPRPEVADLAAPRHRDAGQGCSGRRRSLAGPARGRLELRLLGPVELRRDGEPVQAADWRRERVRSLLAYLALTRHRQPRRRLADDLWPALDQEAQSAQPACDADLPAAGAGAGPGAARRLVLRPPARRQPVAPPGESLAVDVWEFDALCERGRDAERRGPPSAALDRTLGAVELWRGEPTELLSEPWAVAPGRTASAPLRCGRHPGRRAAARPAATPSTPMHSPIGRSPSTPGWSPPTAWSSPPTGPPETTSPPGGARGATARRSTTSASAPTRRRSWSSGCSTAPHRVRARSGRREQKFPGHRSRRRSTTSTSLATGSLPSVMAYGSYGGEPPMAGSSTRPRPNATPTRVVPRPRSGATPCTRRNRHGTTPQSQPRSHPHRPRP